jgi:putative transposon-encoded protein
MTLKKTKGRLILKEIEFEQVYIRTVHKSNKRSGKITLPPDLIGKKVYVIVES